MIHIFQNALLFLAKVLDNAIVKDILQDFYKLETGYMDTIRDCITGRADKLIQLEKQREEAR